MVLRLLQYSLAACVIARGFIFAERGRHDTSPIARDLAMPTVYARTRMESNVAD